MSKYAFMGHTYYSTYMYRNSTLPHRNVYFLFEMKKSSAF